MCTHLIRHDPNCTNWGMKMHEFSLHLIGSVKNIYNFRKLKKLPFYHHTVCQFSLIIKLHIEQQFNHKLFYQCMMFSLSLFFVDIDSLYIANDDSTVVHFLMFCTLQTSDKMQGDSKYPK